MHSGFDKKKHFQDLKSKLRWYLSMVINSSRNSFVNLFRSIFGNAFGISKAYFSRIFSVICLIISPSMHFGIPSVVSLRNVLTIYLKLTWTRNVNLLQNFLWEFNQQFLWFFLRQLAFSLLCEISKKFPLIITTELIRQCHFTLTVPFYIRPKLILIFFRNFSGQRHFSSNDYRNSFSLFFSEAFWKFIYEL